MKQKVTAGDCVQPLQPALSECKQIMQFAYCPLFWMFCQRSSNTRINHLHKRVLRIVYNDNKSTFEDFLKKNNSISIHQKNIRL